MRILLLGSGGRESALAWKIAQSPRVNQFFIAPGNPGTIFTGINVNIKPTDFEAVRRVALTNDIDMIVVGPEDPLVHGIADFLQADPARWCTALPTSCRPTPRRATSASSAPRRPARSWREARTLPSTS